MVMYIQLIILLSVLVLSSAFIHQNIASRASKFVDTKYVRRTPSLSAYSKSAIAPTMRSNYNVAIVIPTGIGARIGGFAGDGLPVAKLFSSVVGDGYVVTHPNVVNGAMLYETINNVLYVEGYSLDRFAKGELGLKVLRKKSQKIGLLLDKGIEDSLRIRHIQVANAAKATLGIDIHSYIITSRPIGVSLKISSSGASYGSINDSQSLIDAAEKLIHNGCTAIAIVARFPEDDEIDTLNSSEMFKAYRDGEGVDAIAGVEAIISHIISKKFKIPCAHAPAFSPIPPDENVSPKACAEELGYTFLPCVLANLHRAPDLMDLQSSGECGLICNSDIDSVVTPIDALGGAAVLSFLSQGKLIVAVEENETSMKVTRDQIVDKKNIVVAKSYAEAAGIVAAHRAGIVLQSITRSVTPPPLIS